MDQFLFKFTQYFNHAFSDSMELFIGLGSLVLLYILILSLLSFSKAKRSTFNILKSLYISSFIVITILLIVAICIWNFTELFARRPSQFVFFLTEVVLLVLPVLSLVLLSNHYTRDNLHKLAGVSYSIRERDGFYHEAKQSFSKVKYFFLLPLVPFLLLLIQNPNPSLLSIVVDNSSSMNQFDEVKDAIARPLSRVDEKTMVTLAHFEVMNAEEIIRNPAMRYKENVKDIVEEEYFDDLIGAVEFFSNRNSAIEYFNYDEGFTTSMNGTPLYECLWKNYLYVKDVIPIDQQFKKKILIVATDGEGFLTDDAYPGSSEHNFNIFMYASTDGQTMSQYYDEIALINFGSGEDPFWYSMTSSNIYNGGNPSSIQEAMKSITGKVSVDWMFIILLAIPLGLVMLILLFIVPKKL